MENVLREPLIEGLVGNDCESREFSEWKLLPTPIGLLPTVRNPGYVNRDFRNSTGTPVVDPDTYRKLENEIMAIGTSLFRNDFAIKRRHQC